MLNKIHPIYFIVSFCVGLFACYLMNPKPEIIYKFPSPYNAGQVTYKDEANDTCYKYKADKVECPLDKGLIKPQPID